jgi:ribonuclease E
MSRQRLRTNFFESNSVVCPHCKGSGFIRSHLTASVWILREVEARIAGGYVREIRTTVNMELGHYILNKLRGKINELERKYDAEILFIGSNRMILGNAEFVVTKKKSGDERSEVSTHQVDISKLYEEKSIENKAEHKKEEVVSTETSTLLEEDLGEQQPLSNERNDYNKPNYSNRSGSNDRGGDRGGRYQNNNKGGRRFDNRDNRGGDNRAGGENRGGQGGHGGQKENSFRPNNRNNNRGGDFGARPNNNSYSQYKNDYRNESKTYDNVPVNEPIANDSNLQNTPEDGKGDKEKSRLMGLWKKFTG